jgi:hypothetical protein
MRGCIKRFSFQVICHPRLRLEGTGLGYVARECPVGYPFCLCIQGRMEHRDEWMCVDRLMLEHDDLKIDKLLK